MDLLRAYVSLPSKHMMIESIPQRAAAAIAHHLKKRPAIFSRLYSQSGRTFRSFLCNAKTANVAEAPNLNSELPLEERGFCCQASHKAVTAWYQKAQQQTKLEAARYKEDDDPTVEDLLVILLAMQCQI